MERRAAANRIDYMTGLLWTLKNEGIERMADFAQTRERLTSQVRELQQQMAVVSRDIVAGKKVVASLETIVQLKELNQRREELSFRNQWRGNRFYKAHKAELDAYDWAKQYLTGQRIPIDVDPDKARAVVAQREELLEDLRQSEIRVRQRMERLELAEREVTASVEDGQELRRESVQRRAREAGRI